MTKRGFPYHGFTYQNGQGQRVRVRPVWGACSGPGILLENLADGRVVIMDGTGHLRVEGLEMG